jgi:hypothetical protein
MRLSLSIVRQPNAYVTQYQTHADRRPYRSASPPAKEALAAPAMNPLAYKAATDLSGMFFSYR